MDALALLCTLYAEGPATLQRLRVGGCGSLASLLELEMESLREQLDWEEGVAERFLREAWILAERLDAGWDKEDGELEQQEDGGAQTIAALMPEPVVKHRKASSKEDLVRREELLQRWRELDSERPPLDPTCRTARTVRAQVQDGSDGTESQAYIPQPKGDPRFAGLGLNPAHLARLESLDILSLDSFARHNGFELSQILQLPFTRVQRMQLLARRESPIEDPVALLAAESPGEAHLNSQPENRRQDQSLGEFSKGKQWQRPVANPDSSLDAAGPFA